MREEDRYETREEEGGGSCSLVTIHLFYIPLSCTTVFLDSQWIHRFVPRDFFFRAPSITQTLASSGNPPNGGVHASQPELELKDTTNPTKLGGVLNSLSCRRSH